MSLSKERQLFIDMVVLAQCSFEELTDEEIQNLYGSDYHHEMKMYLRSIIGRLERGEIHA